MFVDQQFFVGIQDSGVGGQLTDKALVEAMSDTANVHGRMVGQSSLDNEATDFAWVVLNWKLEVVPGARPLVCDSYTVRTWARSYSRAFSIRDFEAFDADGNRFARATSKWAVVGRRDRAMVKLTSDIMDCYGIEADTATFPPDQDKFDRMRIQAPAARELPFAITKSMIDCNQHVHNTAYLDLVQEALPDGADQQLFDHLEIAYRHEIAPGSTVMLRYVPLENGSHFVAIDNAETGGSHATALMR